MTQQNHRAEEIDLAAYMRVIYRYRFMIIGMIVIGMLSGGIPTARQPIQYQTSATFFPLNLDSANSGIAMSGQKNSVSNMIISILKCRTMADRIIDQLDLKKLWGKNLSVDTRRKLRGISEISVGENGLIKLKVTLPDPVLAAEVANAYVDNLEYLNAEFQLGARRKIVQVIDRAIVPEKPLADGFMKKITLSGMASFMLAVLLAFFLEFMKKINIVKRLREK